MREIQFRGKLIKNNKWVCGDLIHDTQNNVYVYPLWSEGLYIGNRVFPDTVGQFTGLHDKNGTDIYDGDIVHLDAWSPYAMQVVFMEGAFCLANKDGEFLGDIHYIHHAGVEQCTILGNIHDNPELLNKEG